jgi:hypothetical protein
MMTFEKFRASGRDVDDIGEELQADGMEGVSGRVYADRLWAVPCVDSGVGWMTVIGDREHQSPRLADIERELFLFAVADGIAL